MNLPGILSSDAQLKTLADGIIDRAKASGLTLEDHGADLLHAAITSALTELFADVKQAEDPILAELRKANASIAEIADTFAQFRLGVSIVPRTQGVV